MVRQSSLRDSSASLRVTNRLIHDPATPQAELLLRVTKRLEKLGRPTRRTAVGQLKVGKAFPGSGGRHVAIRAYTADG